MKFLSDQTDKSGMCFLIHAADNKLSFIIDKYVVGDHVNDETVIIVDDMDDAHNKCIDMIIKNYTLFERPDEDNAVGSGISHLLVITHQVAKKSMRGQGTVVICNKKDMNAFVELKLTGFKNYTFIIDDRIPVGHLLSIYKCVTEYDAIGAVINSIEGDQYWLKLQDNYLDYCCMSEFDFSNEIVLT